MQAVVDGQSQTLIPLADFRAQLGLPDTFNMRYFEPKDWDVGSMDRAGEQLAQMRQQVLETVPPAFNVGQLLVVVEQLVFAYRRELEAINARIKLRDVEVDFAVSGFSDVLHAVAYKLIQLAYVHRGHIAEMFQFEDIYQKWLDDSVRVGGNIFPYEHLGRMFNVQVIYNIYGRIGLRVMAGDAVYYVADASLSCPAWGYMDTLCRHVSDLLVERLEVA